MLLEFIGQYKYKKEYWVYRVKKKIKNKNKIIE